MQTIQLLARARRLLRLRPPRARARRPRRGRDRHRARVLRRHAAAPGQPDLGQADGWTYISQPIAIHVDDTEVRIERIRQRVGPHGERVTTDDEIRLQVVTPGGLAEEAAPHGLEAEELRHIPETPEHIATQVVIFRG